METLKYLYLENKNSIEDVVVLEILYKRRDKETKKIYNIINIDSLEETLFEIVKDYKFLKSLLEEPTTLTEDDVKRGCFKSIMKYGCAEIADYKRFRELEFNLYKFENIELWKTK